MAHKGKHVLEDETYDDEPIQISSGICENLPEKTLCIVGKVWTRKSFNVFALLDTMKKLWNPAGGVTCREIESNLFSFQFSDRRDLERVLSMEPWTFNKHILVLKEANPNIQPSAMEMDSVPFWVRFYDVPLSGRKEEILEQIGSRFGTVLEIDKSTVKGMGRSVRMKILLNLGKPLRKGTKICIDKAATIWLPVKYERLQSFCYWCGRLGHSVIECEDKEEEKEEVKNRETDLPYGDWLRASPMKQSKVVIEVGARTMSGSQRKLWYKSEGKNEAANKEKSEATRNSMESTTNSNVDEIAINLGKVMVNNTQGSLKYFEGEEGAKKKGSKEEKIPLTQPAHEVLPKPNHLMKLQEKITNSITTLPTPPTLIPIADLFKLCQPSLNQKNTNLYKPPHKQNPKNKQIIAKNQSATYIAETPTNKEPTKPTHIAQKTWTRTNREAQKSIKEVFKQEGKRKTHEIVDEEMEDTTKKQKSEEVEIEEKTSSPTAGAAVQTRRTS